MTNRTDVATTEGTEVATAPKAEQVDIGKIMALAEAGIDPDAVGKLVDLYERVHAIQSEQGFNMAMHAVQQHMDANPVPLRGEVVITAGVKAPYALLEDIQRGLAPVCARHGFSYSFDTEVDGKAFTVITRVSHIMGVTRETRTTLPLDTSGSKNATQGVGSTESYGMRYGLIKAFGLARYLLDDDAAGPEAPVITDTQLADLVSLMQEVFGTEKFQERKAKFIGHIGCELGEIRADRYADVIRELEGARVQ